MKLKQFLKPDWRKIVIFVVLFLFLFPLSIISPGPTCRLSKVCNTASIVNIFGIEYYEFDAKYRNFFENLAIISIIIFYILSCLIVWIYDRRKKK